VLVFPHPLRGRPVEIKGRADDQRNPKAPQHQRQEAPPSRGWRGSDQHGRSLLHPAPFRREGNR
jgi:hypothetical protein